MKEDVVVRWSSRKFWAMMFWQGVMTVLLMRGYLPAEAFVSITWLLLGAYFAANAAQHIWEKKL